MTSNGINFNYLPEKELTKFGMVDSKANECLTTVLLTFSHKETL